MPRLSFPPYTLFEERHGAGTPIVLLHGLSGSSRWWSRNIPVLAERHLVAALDLLGFGRSQAHLGLPRVLPPFEDATALVARYLETFSEPVHLCGHSMGGLIAIGVAAARPDFVRSLMLVDAAGMPFRLDPRPHAKALPKPPYGGPGIARVLLSDFFRAGPTSVAVAGSRVLRGDVREMMHALRMPVLLVWGENDPLVPLRYGQAMLHEIEGAKLVVIPRAAHVAMWDVPDAFNRIALEFVDGVEKKPAPAPGPPSFNWGIAGWTDGIAHRQAGRRKDVVLVHGLGMSSSYFVRFARALFDHGWNPIAPDLPGFGESADASASGPAKHARILAEWADALTIRDAVWVGHSIGCNAVEHLARTRPDVVRRLVLVGPLWTRSRFPRMRIFSRLVLDAIREPLGLYRYVIAAYWRAGFARWWMTAERYVPDITHPPALPAGTIVIAGERDPLPDRDVTPAIGVPGAHACQFSEPEATSGAAGFSPPTSKLAR
jgi:pimeloyl-ACP methyl ester carboxylesterase